MLPAELSTCPIRTQVRQVSQALRDSVYVQFKSNPTADVPGTEPQWFVQANGQTFNPTTAARIQNDQYKLTNVAWRTYDVQHVYYYNATPVITLTDHGPLYQAYWNMPWFEYWRPHPIMPASFVNITISVYIYVSEHIDSFGLDPTDWLVTVNGTPIQPFAMAVVGRFIELQHIQFLIWPIEHVEYLGGDVPFLSATGGPLLPFSLDFPYPP